MNSLILGIGELKEQLTSEFNGLVKSCCLLGTNHKNEKGPVYALIFDRQATVQEKSMLPRTYNNIPVEVLWEGEHTPLSKLPEGPCL